jgi:hypothetical protein
VLRLHRHSVVHPVVAVTGTLAIAGTLAGTLAEVS